MNAHESEHVSEDESEVVPAIVVGYVDGSDPGYFDAHDCVCVLHLHVYAHVHAQYHHEHADGNE